MVFMLLKTLVLSPCEFLAVPALKVWCKKMIQGEACSNRVYVEEEMKGETTRKRELASAMA
jgi:hypothetical protein